MNEIFVFGSNLAGRHGKGAALEARKNHGAIYGQAFGLQGNSFAIPTKDEGLKTLPMWRIEAFVKLFLDSARMISARTFRLTPIGCGLVSAHKRGHRVPAAWFSPHAAQSASAWV